jgi:hypothetical protein
VPIARLAAAQVILRSSIDVAAAFSGGSVGDETATGLRA